MLDGPPYSRGQAAGDKGPKLLETASCTLVQLRSSSRPGGSLLWRVEPPSIPVLERGLPTFSRQFPQDMDLGLGPFRADTYRTRLDIALASAARPSPTEDG